MRLYSSLCCCHPRLLCLSAHQQSLEQTQAINPSRGGAAWGLRTRSIRLEPHHHVQRGFVLDRPSVAVDLGEPLAVVEEPPAKDQHELLHRRRRCLRPHFCAQNGDERIVGAWSAGGAAHSRRGPPAAAPSAPAPSSPWRTSRRTAARAASEPAGGAGRAPRGARARSGPRRRSC